MKNLIYTVLIFSSSAYSQSNRFELTYDRIGMGSNIYKFYPSIRIKSDTLTYIIEKKTSKFSVQRYRNARDTAWVYKETKNSVLMRKQSITAIFESIKDIKDTAVFHDNPCIMSGGMHYLVLKDSAFTKTYTLINTIDSTALLIFDIINEYLPTENRIWASKTQIDNENKCRLYIFEEAKKKMKNYHSKD